MSKMPNSLSSFLLVVAFLVLTAIATTLYSGNAEQKTKMESSLFWQKTNLAFGSAWFLLQALSDMGLKKYDTNPAADSNYNQDSESVAAGSMSGQIRNAVAGAGSAATVDFLSSLKTKIKEEWDKSGTASPETGSGSKLSNNFARPWEWRQTETGAEIIFKLESGEQYILPLPFSFLKAE
jgi:hypothetical protein